MSSITRVTTSDVRFPTSRHLDGSDAMNKAPDYSAAYVVVETDAADGLSGHAFVFTCGVGNDLQTDCIAKLAKRLVGRDAEQTLADLGGLWRELVYDSDWRWLGPEKGVVHMGIGAVVNALWDLRSKRAGKPLWKVLVDLSPEELVDLADFRYLTGALTREDALAILDAAAPGRAEREAELLAHGYPAYTTTPGWLGYTDEKLATLSREAVAEGFGQIKLKVGGDVEDDVRRLKIAREAVGPEVRIAIDANQVWEVDQAIAWVQRLAEFDLAWIEEPTSPDDVLGHAEIARGVAPIPVATGEMTGSRVMFRQFLQAGALSVMQIDATRVAGVNENITNLLLAAKFGVRVCPHAGGVGLCEAVQHLSMFDYVAVTGELEGRMIEYVDHLHEHFVVPTDVREGRYWPPSAPGAGTEMLAESVRDHTYRPPA